MHVSWNNKEVLHGISQNLRSPTCVSTERNARRLPKKQPGSMARQRRQLAISIRRGRRLMSFSRSCRVEAAKLLELVEVPSSDCRLPRRGSAALALADTGSPRELWTASSLGARVPELTETGFTPKTCDIGITGFEPPGDRQIPDRFRKLTPRDPDDEFGPQAW